MVMQQTNIPKHCFCTETTLQNSYVGQKKKTQICHHHARILKVTSQAQQYSTNNNYNIEKKKDHPLYSTECVPNLWFRRKPIIVIEVHLVIKIFSLTFCFFPPGFIRIYNRLVSVKLSSNEHFFFFFSVFFGRGQQYFKTVEMLFCCLK